MRRCILATAMLAGAVPAAAQRASDNAVTAAEDAFGSSIGNESIGLYSSFQVRGFSPSVAGNVRIEGLYLDNRTVVSSRLVAGSTIRVGISAIGYPSPAPTGIVDYRLRKARDDAMLSVVGGLGDYAGPFLELDAQLPITARLSLAAGISYGFEEYYDGADARFFRTAIAPRWQPTDDVEIIPFWSLTTGRDEEAAPTIITNGNFAPPEIARRRFFGQDWATRESESGTSGIIAKARLGGDWALAAGVFRSRSSSRQSFADLYLTDDDGAASEVLIPDPPQRAASWSGEIRVSRSFTEGDRLHTLHASGRARRRSTLYGGSAAPIELAPRPLGERLDIAEPERFVFAERSRDRLRQVTLGLAYHGRWRDVGELSLGIQRTDYRKTVEQPATLLGETEDSLWLYNAALALKPAARLAIYVGYTRGLEESGVAPDNAANRLEVLPPIRTSQWDAGFRYRLTDRLTLIAGWFDVRKPYFSNDENKVFTELGEVRHQGLEASLTGTPVEGLTIVAGAVVMRPRVAGEAVALGRVGERPVGRSGTILRANVNYALPFAEGVSLNLAVSHNGSRVASRDNSLVLPGYTLVDMGARYGFRLGSAPASFRVALSNVTDTYYLDVLGANSFGLTDGQRLSVYLAVDF